MPRKRQDDSQATPPGSTVTASDFTEASEPAAEASDAGAQANSSKDGIPNGPKDRLVIAREKLARMEETNKICFRHRNDLAKIEQELGRLGYGDSEIEHLMEPKGTKLIPGFGFSDIERQRQYVNFLTSKRAAPGEAGHAASEDQRRSGGGELEVG